MHGKNSLRKIFTSLTAIAVWCVYSTVAFAVPNSAAGDITVSGQVSVNGQTAVSNSTFLSGSSVTTGDNSTATISLGRAFGDRAPLFDKAGDAAASAPVLPSSSFLARQQEMPGIFLGRTMIDKTID